MDTISRFQRGPTRVLVDMTGVKAHAFLERLDAVDRDTQAEAPEEVALLYYLYHALEAHLLKCGAPSKPIEEGVAKTARGLYEASSLIALRMAYYLFVICTRESRHALKNSGGFKKMEDTYPEFREFHGLIKDAAPLSSVKTAFGKLPADVTLGRYADWLVDVFTHPKYSTNFGGKKWRAIAVPFAEVVHGRMTMDTMCDTAFALSHNTGPIFNKGVLFRNYVGTGKQLLEILDIQRSGQIPEYLFSFSGQFDWGGAKNTVLNDCLVSLAASGYSLGPVDWFRVEALGGIGNYKYQQSKQTTDSTYKSAAQKAAEQAEEQAAAKAAKALSKFTVMPGLMVQEIEREDLNVAA